ncbi:Eco57I restriction-modification methylase domain-containing protein [Nostoc flagelliforme FACHB-838]|uniref:site-specific DNA-methyltransferase (adenine-specific) n=1 Tax=Nostoc flagelliforme FACHB-838 TaxID=2692904 RepID=A0ABR8DM05_9NOSO|nr:type ISP restriction/modification enzyme [Nostoc flagelliforme]MBD2530303.1 Eco57I restriction-modification methylase domain-containing protein [Nostoc flagelliforme FACHB-838]
MSKLLVSQYHTEVERIIQYGGSRKETSIRVAFQNLVNEYCKPREFRLIPELDYKTPSGRLVYPDGTVKDALRLDWGYWESKDEYDNLDQEIEKKLIKGYPDSNILFEDSQTAVLIQGGQETMRVPMKDADALDGIITYFINYVRPEVKDFREAIETFKQDLPTVLNALRDLIDSQIETNAAFQTARAKFWGICKESINPEVTLLDVREMMIQHILTEDIFISIFNESQFHRENNIARELKTIIDTFFTGSTKKNTLGTIERYYGVIRRTAANIYNHHEKQKFLKVLYENFYKAYNPKAADRLGIVYTPNEIVRFMIESVDYLVNKNAMSVENTERIKRQNESKISVIIGNPPYNAKQENFNDNNSNRCYGAIDKLIKNTYIKYSKAQNKIVVYDMYTRFIRWATDRLSHNGILAFITNSSFIDARTFDGLRKVVSDEFSDIYIVDLHGDVRKNPKLSGTTHNVFGIQTGVAIIFMIKRQVNNGTPCKIFHTRRPDFDTVEEKLKFLAETKFTDIHFEHITPDKNHNWINQTDNDFDNLLPLVDKDVKAGKVQEAVFKLFSRGVATQRDEWVYDLCEHNLTDKMKYFVKVYQHQLAHKGDEVSQQIKWDEDLISYLKRGINKNFDAANLKSSLYRPFYKEKLYFDKHFNGRTYQWFSIYKKDENNYYICLPGIGASKPFQCLMTNQITCLDFLEKTQCFSLYYYDKDGNRIDNITDWGLTQFQTHYKDSTISKLDIFHYTYAVLHNPAYRTKYELNLKREFPRISFYDDFHQWVNWGKQLMDLHINYETVEPYPLKRIDLPLATNRIPKAKLKADAANGTIILDDVTTLEGVPKIAWEYRLGNRCALEWILDQYKEKKPKDPTIAEKFNTYRFADYKEQVIDLLQRVCTVSVETMQIIQQI